VDIMSLVVLGPFYGPKETIDSPRRSSKRHFPRDDRPLRLRSPAPSVGRGATIRRSDPRPVPRTQILLESSTPEVICHVTG
jgi:hypothetical protein